MAMTFIGWIKKRIRKKLKIFSWPIVKKNGKVDVAEVGSKTDKREVLFQRNDEIRQQLPLEKQGEIKIIEPTKIEEHQ